MLCWAVLCAVLCCGGLLLVWFAVLLCPATCHVVDDPIPYFGMECCSPAWHLLYHEVLLQMFPCSVPFGSVVPKLSDSAM